MGLDMSNLYMKVKAWRLGGNPELPLIGHYLLMQIGNHWLLYDIDEMEAAARRGESI